MSENTGIQFDGTMFDAFEQFAWKTMVEDLEKDVDSPVDFFRCLHAV